MHKRIIVCGGTKYSDYDAVNKKLTEIVKNFDSFEIISGHAEGVDKMGERFAEEHSCPCAIFPAEWNKYGRAAGPIRNSQMIKYACGGEPLVVAFWNGTSRGTLDTINKAKAKGIDCIIVLHGEKENDKKGD